MDEVGYVVPKYRVGAGSDPGRRREKNEDAYLSRPAEGIFAVIDGVGGHAGGEVAAAEARGVLYHRLSHRTGTPEVRLREAVTNANSKIFVRSRNESMLFGMACVLTAVVVEDEKVFAAHVGDTRLYKIKAGRIRKLTRDHSFVGLREDSKELTEYEAMHHPRRNEILRDVGSEVHEPDDPHFIDIVEEPFEPDAALLLCSDGLTDLVPSRDLLRMVSENAGDPQAAVEALIEAANEAGGKDNITVIVIEGETFGTDDPLRKMAAAQAALTQKDRDRDTGAIAAQAPLPGPTDDGTDTREEASSASRLQEVAEIPEPSPSISPLRYYLLGAATVIGLLGMLYVLWRVSPFERASPPPAEVVSSNGDLAAPPSDQLAGALHAFWRRTGAGDTLRLPAGTYQETLQLAEDLVLMRDTLGQIRVITTAEGALPDSLSVQVSWGAAPNTVALRIGPMAAGTPGHTLEVPSGGLVLYLLRAAERVTGEQVPDSTSSGL